MTEETPKTSDKLAGGAVETGTGTEKTADYLYKITHPYMERAMVRRPAEKPTGKRKKTKDIAVQQMELFLEYVVDKSKKQLTEDIPKRIREARLSVYERKLLHYGEVVLAASGYVDDRPFDFGAAFGLSDFHKKINSKERMDNFSAKAKRAIARIEGLVFRGMWAEKEKAMIRGGGVKAHMEAAATPTSILKTSGGSYVKGNEVFLLFDPFYVAAIYRNGGGRIQPIPARLLSVDGDAYLMGHSLSMYARGTQNSHRQKDGLFHYSVGSMRADMGRRSWTELQKTRAVAREKREIWGMIEALVDAGVLSKTPRIQYPHSHLSKGKVIKTVDDAVGLPNATFDSLILAYDIAGIDGEDVKAFYLKPPQGAAQIESKGAKPLPRQF